MYATFLNALLSHLYNSVPLFASALLALIAGRFLFLRTTSFHSHKELIARPNPAYGLVLGAYLFAAGFAIAGAFFGSRQLPPLTASGILLVYGLLTVVLLRVTILINDRFILHTFSIEKEIARDRNLGAAFCVTGSILAGGLILNGAMTGYSDGFGHGLRDVILFWALGQLIQVAASRIYGWSMKYDVHRLIEYDDNVGVGVGFGGFLAGLGLIVRATLKLADTREGHLSSTLLETGLLASLGALLLLAINGIVLRLLFPKARYEHDVEMKGNLAVAIVSAAANLALALILAAILQRGPS